MYFRGWLYHHYDDCILGGDYTITMILETIDGTGMGQISLLIKAESSVMKNKTYLMDPQFTNRTLKWVGKANMDPDCESNCKPWLPGKYILEMGKIVSV